MFELKNHFVETNGIRIHVAEQGEGPLVLLCHGFPESWYSWRHQLSALAKAGYRAVAPDMRRNGARNWESLAALDGLQITVPALYIAGDRDLVMAFEAWARVNSILPQENLYDNGY